MFPLRTTPVLKRETAEKVKNILKQAKEIEVYHKPHKVFVIIPMPDEDAHVVITYTPSLIYYDNYYCFSYGNTLVTDYENQVVDMY